MNNERRVMVRGTSTAIEAWLQTLTGLIPGDWSRALDIEQKAKGKRNGRWPICLVWAGNGLHPRTAIFLQPISDTEIGIMSMVPLDKRELAPEDRAAALDAFRTALLASPGNELQLTDKPGSAGLLELISPNAHARFMAFARRANKTMLHSGLDLPRWYDFLIQLHRDNATPPREALEKALEEESFSPSIIVHLLNAYEHTDEILTRYDEFGESE